MLVSTQEIRCIHVLAEWFERGETEVNGAEAVDRMSLTWDEFNPLMRKMHHLGAVEVVLGLNEDPVDLFRLSPRAVELAREIDEKTRQAAMAPDFVEQIQTRFRRHPVVGWAIVIIVALTVVVGLLADLVTVLKALGFVS